MKDDITTDIEVTTVETHQWNPTLEYYDFGIEVTTVETHQWNATLEYHDFGDDYDVSLKADPCPQCGEDGIFNIRYSEGVQMVGTAEKDDNDKQICRIDDGHHLSLEFARCGNCGQILLDKDE